MNNISKIASLFAMITSTSALAFWHEARINSIHTYIDGGIAVYLDTAHECGSARLAFDQTASGFDMIYSSLLAYEAQGKLIRFDISSCNGSVGVVNRIVSIN